MDMAEQQSALFGNHPLTRRLDRIIDGAIQEKRIVGTVVLAAHNGQRIYGRAAGFADREADRPMTEDQIFRIASFTKPLVSCTALALAERNVIRLDDPVSRWLPSFRPKLPDGREPVITIRHLLTHTAGLSYRFREPVNGPYHQADVSDGMDQPGLRFEENLRRIISVPLLFEPGTAWAYSVATDILGQAIAKAAATPLPALVQRLITGPLGMNDTAFTVRDTQRLAVPYADGDPEPVRVREYHRVQTREGTEIAFAPGRILDPDSFDSGGAGMAGTAADYLKFLNCLQAGGSPILGADSVEGLTSNQIGDIVVSSRGPGWGWSLGFAILTDPDLAGSPQSAGSYQWGGAYGHTWFVDRAMGLAVVALTNTTPEGVNGMFPAALQQAFYVAGS